MAEENSFADMVDVIRELSELPDIEIEVEPIINRFVFYVDLAWLWIKVPCSAN